MAKAKNKHAHTNYRRRTASREQRKKNLKFFENKEDAMEYAGTLALNGRNYIATYKHNGQFKDFKHGEEIYVRKHKTAPIITKAVEIVHPVINNTQPIIETITSV